MPAPPLWAQLRAGGLPLLAGDSLAGTLTAILLIPQALAYALLAGLPPQVGLYASVLPVVAYALLGSSRSLAVGPVAVAAIMVSAALGPYAAGDPERYLSGALMLSLLSGLLLLAMAALRLGWLANFVSHPVLSGFTTGAALFIIATQLPALTAIPASSVPTLPALLPQLADGVAAINPAVVLAAGAALALLVLARQPLVVALRRLGGTEPLALGLSRMAPLAVVALAIVLSAQLDAAARYGVAVVGSVPQGLPLPSLDVLRGTDWQLLLPSAAMIALVAYVESLSVAKALAFRRREAIDADRELLALGGANVTAAFAGAMPVAGGFARSMVNFDAGARSQWAALVTAAWVALAAMFFSGLVADLPKAVLAALIVVAVWQLVDLRHLRETWRYDRADGLAQGLTLVGVLMLGIEPGLLLGVGTALVLFLYRTSRPHIAVVGRVPGSDHYRNIHRHAVQTFPGVLLLRVDESLYFANAPYVETELQTRVLETPGLRAVVLIMSGVNAVDASGLEVLEALADGLATQQVPLHLAEIKGPVLDQLARSRVYQRIGTAAIHLSTQAAVDHLCGGPQG